jgi:hypothetical protein
LFFPERLTGTEWMVDPRNIRAVACDAKVKSDFIYVKRKNTIIKKAVPMFGTA